VGKGFDPGAGEVDVPERGGVEDPEVLATFGGDVDVARGGEGRGGDPEDFLLEDPFNKAGWDGFVESAHCASTAN